MNLLPNFEDKLAFRKLEPYLGFVGIKLLPEEVQFKAREEPAENHLVVRL